MGRNFKAVANDIAEGYVTINPIYLKPLAQPELVQLNEMLTRKQHEIRIEPFPYNEVEKIRRRNLRLQRIYGALIMLRNFARERKINLS